MPRKRSNDMLQELTSDVVAAYVRNNSVPASELASLIASVHNAFRRQGCAGVTQKPVPAVPIKRSVTKDFIVCLEDGRRFKSIKRHLMIHHQMAPHEYRIRWDLPADYPMVAKSYSEARSALSKELGLGQKRLTKTAGARGARKSQS